MKVLVVYGGPINNQSAFNKTQTSSLSKTTNVSNLSMNVQFLINTITNEIKNQKIAAVDDIEVISRHMSDLKDYIYE